MAIDVKEKLRELSNHEYKLKSKRLKLEALRTLSVENSSKLDSQPSGTSSVHSRNEELVCKIIELEEEIKKEEIELQKEKVRMLELIEHISDLNEQRVLIERYIQHMNWQEIADSLYCSISWTYRLHGRALESLRHVVSVEGGAI